MEAPDDDIIDRLRYQIRSGNIRVSYHAHQEMVEDGFTLDEVLYAVAHGQVIENYPQHRRGACCLVSGSTLAGRPVHVVCTTARPVLIIITVYEPKPPKWLTPTQRGQRS